jgi:hypothetical protein
MSWFKKAGGDISNSWKKSDAGRAVSGSTDGFNKSLDINRKGFNKDWVPGLRVAGATGLGYAVGGPIGAGIAGGLTAAGQYGKKGGGEQGPPQPEKNWWEVGRPETRREITNKEGKLNDGFKLEAGQVQAPGSRMTELDSRLNKAGDVGFLNAGNIGAGAALAGLSARSLSNDLSSQAQARMGLIDQQRRAGMDAMNANVAGSTAGAMSNLAASGGMDSGARQRLASDAIKARMGGASGLFNQAAQNKSQVGITDLANQYDLQTRMPGMFMDYGRNQMAADQFNSSLAMDKVNAYQNQGRMEDDRSMIASRDNVDNAMRANQFNIQNQIADRSASDAFDMDKWKTSNAAKAGELTANAQNYYAQQQSKRGLLGNRGGILGTGLGE